MFYIAIESSCDETSLAILESSQNSDSAAPSFYTKINLIKVVSSVISSQIETHKLYGGVVPEIGARLHAEQIHSLYHGVLQEALEQLNLHESNFYSQLETVFITTEPGLMSALRVGIEFAKSLKFYILQNYHQEIDIQNVNHLQGHIASCFYEIDKKEIKSFENDQIFPHLHLMVSGGNTQIRLLNSWDDWQIIGQTIDDAAGECFDKAARMVGIPYPGGATLSRIAGEQYSNPVELPIAMLQSKNLNISLSGLKTAVRYKVQKSQIPGLILDEPLTLEEIELLKTQKEFLNQPKLQFVKEICVSTQYAIIEQLVRKIDKAIQQYTPKSIGISGGVSANKVLVQNVQKLESIQSLPIPKVFAPDPSVTGDNAIMIGIAGLIKKLHCWSNLENW
jgi:N6-L-threonylcarbamoyladenine synthase